MARFRGHALHVTFNLALVQRVELSHFRQPAGRFDVLRKRVELRARAADQKHARPFACKGPSDASTYASACAVNDCCLALEKFRHVRLLRFRHLGSVLLQRGRTTPPILDIRPKGELARQRQRSRHMS